MRWDEHLSAAVTPTLYRLTGKPYGEMQVGLRAGESLSEDELAALQMTRLGELLTHCYENVPYYRARFDELGARPSDIRTLEDFKRFPTLSRVAQQENFTSLVATNFDHEALVRVQSGGSTGDPVVLMHDQRYIDLGWAALLRNVGWTGHRPGERQMWFTRPLAGGWKRRLGLAVRRHWYVGVRAGNEESVIAWVAALVRQRPRLIYGYPSAITSIAEYMLDNAVHCDSVRQVMVSSETLSERQRGVIEQAFDAQVFSQYGSQECYSIASECQNGNMHVNTDINLVEFLPLDTHDDTREVVVTPLFSRGSPLVRYRIGDEADALQGRCACGRPFPLMRLDVGRLGHTLRMSDGRILSTFAPEHAVKDLRGVARYQFRQMPDDSLTLLIVPARGADLTVEAAAVVEDTLAAEAGFRVKVNPVLVDDIPLTAVGKHKSVIPLAE